MGCNTKVGDMQGRRIAGVRAAFDEWLRSLRFVGVVAS